MDKPTDVNSYAIGILTDVVIGDGVVEYLGKIDATLAEFGGRFLVHGAEATVHEGVDPGTIVVIEFASQTGATDWYRSADYQAIIALRADNSNSIILTVDGVPAGHLATDVLAAP